LHEICYAKNKKVWWPCAGKEVLVIDESSASFVLSMDRFVQKGGDITPQRRMESAKECIEAKETCQRCRSADGRTAGRRASKSQYESRKRGSSSEGTSGGSKNETVKPGSVFWGTGHS